MNAKAKVLIAFLCSSIAILFQPYYTKNTLAQLAERGNKTKVPKIADEMDKGNISVKVIQSSKAGDRLTSKANLTFMSDDSSNLPVIQINSKKVYHKIVGFGGAFTPAVAHVINQISPEKRREVLNAYFGPNGSHYTLMRTMIGSYYGEQISYDDIPGDTSLTHFTIRFDSINGLLPLIRDAMALSGSKLRIFGFPCNQIGGPLQLGNVYLSAPILADTITSELIYNPSYYYIAHFSKYIRPGAYRIDFSVSHPDLQTTAFKNPDHSIVVAVMNQTDNTIDFKIKNDEGKIINPTIPAHSIIDFIYNRQPKIS